MPNHVHLVATPRTESSFGQVFRLAHSTYARRVHQIQERCGHLFQARYFSTVMDCAHFWNAMVYVEQNPQRARLVENASDWEWSSALAHLGQVQDSWLTMEEWSRSHCPSTWETLLQHGLSGGELLLRIREATRTGRPLGDEAFVDSLEARLQIDIRPPRRGRPKSEKQDSKLVTDTIFRGAAGLQFTP